MRSPAKRIPKRERRQIYCSNSRRGESSATSAWLPSAMDRARSQTQAMFSCRPTDVRVYRVLLRRPELPEDPRRVEDFPEDDFPDDRLRERDPRDERSCSPLLERDEPRDSLFERDSDDPPLLLSSCPCLFSNPFFN